MAFISTGNFTSPAPGVVSFGAFWSPTPSFLATGFSTLAADIRGVRKPLKDAVDSVMTGPEGSIAQNFRSQGRPTKWPQLSERAQEERARANYPPTAPILRRSNRLYRAAIAKARWQYRSTSRMGTAFVGRFPPTLRYAASMHFGYEPQSIPARPFMVIQQKDADAIEKHFADWAQSRVRRRLAATAFLSSVRR